MLRYRKIEYRDLPIGQIAVRIDGRYMGVIGGDEASGFHILDKARGRLSERFASLAAVKARIEEGAR